MRRSPITLGLVLGLIVGVAGAAAVATTDDHEQSTVYVISEPSAAPARASVERLADALGVHAPVQEDVGGWVVREGNRLVRVSRTAGLPWFFARFDGPCVLVPGTPGPERLGTVPPSGPSDCPETTGPEGTTAPARPADLPTGDEARAIGVDIGRRAGLVAGRVTVLDLTTAWRVIADPLEVAVSPWAITIGPKGIVLAANGYLTPPEPR